MIRNDDEIVEVKKKDLFYILLMACSFMTDHGSTETDADRFAGAILGKINVDDTAKDRIVSEFVLFTMDEESGLES